MLSSLPWSKSKKTESKAMVKKNEFQENVSQLDQRMAIVQQGLVRTGVRSVQLDTEEIIELLYKIFNPGERDQPTQMIEALN